MISETAPMSEKLKVQYVRSDISEEQAKLLIFQVFDLLLKEDFTAPADKEDRPKINKN